MSYARYSGLGGSSGSAGVISINALTGAITLAAGTGISITPSGNTLTFATSALTSAITSINADTTAAQLLSIGTSGSDFAIVDAGSGSHVFNLPTASASNRGALSSADWSTFNSKQAALTLGDLTASGDPNITVTGGTGAVIGSGANIAVVGGSIVEAVSSVLTLTGATNAILGTGVSIQVKLATTSQSGYLSSTDWNTFNNKGSGTVTAISIASTNGFTGSSSGGATPALTLATSITGILQGNGTAISAATTTGSGSVVLATSPTLVTPALGTPSALVGTNITGTAAGLTAGNVTTNANLTGDVTSSGNATTLATVNSNVGSFGSSTAIPSFTVNGKGLLTAASTNAVIAPAGTLTGTTLAANVVTSSLTAVGTITSGTWTGTTIALANGGTGQTTKAAAFDALQPMTTGGDIIYGGASGTGTRLANGSSGTFLMSNGGTAAPSWASPTIAAIRSQVKVVSATGYGSTGNKIRTYGTTSINTGSDITYASNATNGDTFTLVTAGLYIMTGVDAATVTGNFGFSVNSNQLTTDIRSITAANRIIFTNLTSGGNDDAITGFGIFAANDVIRVHTDGNANASGVDSQFSIMKVGG